MIQDFSSSVPNIALPNREFSRRPCWVYKTIETICRKKKLNLSPKRNTLRSARKTRVFQFHSLSLLAIERLGRNDVMASIAGDAGKEE